MQIDHTDYTVVVDDAAIEEGQDPSIQCPILFDTSVANWYALRERRHRWYDTARCSVIENGREREREETRDRDII